MGPSSFNVSALSSISTRVRSGCCAAPNEASHPLLLRPTLGIAMRPAPAAPALNAASEIRSCCPPASSASGRRPGTNAAEGADAAAVAPLRTARASLAPKATLKCQNLHSRGQRRSMLPKPKQSVAWHGQKLGEAYIKESVACSSKNPSRGIALHLLQGGGLPNPAGAGYCQSSQHSAD